MDSNYKGIWGEHWAELPDSKACSRMKWTASRGGDHSFVRCFQTVVGWLVIRDALALISYFVRGWNYFFILA